MVKNALYELIETRCAERQLSRKAFITAVGFANTSKGLRRLDELRDFHFLGAQFIIDQLPRVLEVDRAEVDAAVNATHEAMRQERDRLWRLNFKPFGIIQTGLNGRPRQITMAALCNLQRYVHIYFAADVPVSEYLPRTMAAFKENETNVRRWFYEPECLVINYTPDHAERYTFEGQYIDTLPHAVVPGMASVRLR
jgi:hypothetical protein